MIIQTKYIKIFVVIFVCCAPIKYVNALTISTTNSYSETLTATGIEAGYSSLSVLQDATPFNSALGTLEDIDLYFSGAVTFDVDIGINYYIDWQGVWYVPYTITPTLSINIDSLNGFYDFDAPITISSVFYTNGISGHQTLTGNYSFGFNYNDILDQFIGPEDVVVNGDISGFQSPSALNNSSLNDFIGSPALFDDLMITYELMFFEETKITYYPSVVQATSVLEVYTDYTYTPHVDVPEPDTKYLFLAGIFLLVALGKKRLSYI